MLSVNYVVFTLTGVPEPIIIDFKYVKALCMRLFYIGLYVSDRK